MKIAINGDIIDLKKIYEITKIIKNEDVNSLYFNIYYSNNNYQKIIIRRNKYLDNNQRFSNLSNTQQEEIDKLILNEITNIRDSIIKIWCENQSEIPQFNL